MAKVKIADFIDDLRKELERLDSGIVLASEMTGISERGLRRILSGGQMWVNDELFDRICTAFRWEAWRYTVHDIKEPEGGDEE